MRSAIWLLIYSILLPLPFTETLSTEGWLRVMTMWSRSKWAFIPFTTSRLFLIRGWPAVAIRMFSSSLNAREWELRWDESSRKHCSMNCSPIHCGNRLMMGYDQLQYVGARKQNKIVFRKMVQCQSAISYPFSFAITVINNGTQYSQ